MKNVDMNDMFYGIVYFGYVDEFRERYAGRAVDITLNGRIIVLREKTDDSKTHYALLNFTMIGITVTLSRHSTISSAWWDNRDENYKSGSVKMVSAPKGY